MEAIEDSSTPEDGSSDEDPSAATSSAAVVDDLERGQPGAAGSDNTMNEEGGAQGAAVPTSATGQPGDADMEFVAGSSLPPIDDTRRQ